MDWKRLRISVLRGLVLSLLVVLILTGRSYFYYGMERVNQEWDVRAKNFLNFVMIVIIVSLVRERQRRRRVG